MLKIIVDKDIELKLLIDEHAVELFNLVNLNRSYLREWLPWLDSNTKVDDSLEFIKSTREQYHSKKGIQTGIWFKNVLCGVIGYYELNWVNKNVSIGYWLSEKHCRQGIITKSCKALIDYAFKELKLNRVEIRCAEMNKKSIAIPERLGLLREGVLREAEWLYDHYVNLVVYSALMKEWISKNS